MDCRKAQENLSFYLDGIMSPEELTLMEAHLKTCGCCQAELAHLTLISAGLREIGSTIYTAPSYLHENIMLQLHEEAATRPSVSTKRNSSLWKRSVIGVAAAAVIAAGALGVDLAQKSDPTNVADQPPKITVTQPPNTTNPLSVDDNQQPEAAFVNTSDSNQVEVASNNVPELTPPDQAAQDSNIPDETIVAIDNVLIENADNTALVSSPGTIANLFDALATSPQAEKTLIKIKIAGEIDIAHVLDPIAADYQTSIVALGEQVSNGIQYSAQQITVKRSQANAAITALGALGEIIDKSTEPINLSIQYNDIFEQYRQSKKLLDSASEAEREALTIERDNLYEQMLALHKSCEETVITIWIEK